MRRRPNLNVEKRAQCVARHEAGHGQRYIAAAVGSSRCAVRNAISRHQDTGGHHDRPGRGRPHQSTAKEDRMLLRLARENPTHTSSLIARDWQQQYVVRCGSKTVRNR